MGGFGSLLAFWMGGYGGSDFRQKADVELSDAPVTRLVLDDFTYTDE